MLQDGPYNPTNTSPPCQQTLEEGHGMHVKAPGINRYRYTRVLKVEEESPRSSVIILYAVKTV